jgi:PPOX class probable FMN-dependent enzyme
MVMSNPPSHQSEQVIDSLAALEELLDPVSPAAVHKEIPFLHPHYQAMIRASPFLILATVGPEGLDASPRGDVPGFVGIPDQQTLHLPERRGNNRADSLRNIIRDPRIGLLFLIPGRGETLRVNGRGRILVTPQLLETFVVQGKPPKCVIEVTVETVYFQCARAILRSNLWQPLPPDLLNTVPSAGTILSALTHDAIDGIHYDRDLPARQGSTLY